MTLDTERQRDVLLSLINQASFPGSMAEEIAALKASLVGAAMAGEVGRGACLVCPSEGDAP